MPRLARPIVICMGAGGGGWVTKKRFLAKVLRAHSPLWVACWVALTQAATAAITSSPGAPPSSSATTWRSAAPRCLPCAGAACSRSVAIRCLRTPPPAVRICFDIGIATPLCFAPAHLPAAVPSPCLPLRRPTTLCFFIRTLTQPLTPHGPLRRASTESGVWVGFWARRVAWDREHL
jgi:hypothetical protein